MPLTEMSTRNLPGGKARPARKAYLAAMCESITYRMWDPRRLTTLLAFMAFYRDSFTFTVVKIIVLCQIFKGFINSYYKLALLKS
jgi:hypothetical protein